MLAREMTVSVLAFLFALIAVAALIHTQIPSPLDLHADERSEKLEMIRQWHGKLYSAAFGSSHVHNGFSPRAFDEVLEGTPIATHTANLAIEGGSQSEQRAMALRFIHQLEAPANNGSQPQPCLIMLELGAGANFTNDHLVHPRAINIYDWKTLVFVRELTSDDMTPRQRYGRIGFALAGSGLYYLNVGMLSNKIFTPPLSSVVLKDQTKDDRRGQLLLPDDPSSTAKISYTISSRPAHLPITSGILTPGKSSLIAELTASSLVSGISFVYFEMPKVNDVDGVIDFRDHLSISTSDGLKQVPIINLARPDRFPQIYAPLLWHDDAHLNGKGAEVVSAILAQQLKLWYAAHGLPHKCGG